MLPLLFALLSTTISSPFGGGSGAGNIVGGQIVQDNRYAFAAKILRDRGGGPQPDKGPNSAAQGLSQDRNLAYFCAASILDSLHIISAAHCFYDKDKKSMKDITPLFIGVGSLKNTTDNPLPIDSVVLHPDYDSDKRINDLAIVKLKDPLTFNDAVQPIKRCEQEPLDAINECISNNKKIITLGWGLTEKREPSAMLKDVEVSVLMPNTTEGTNSFCAASTPSYVNDHLFCLGGSPGKDSCTGDSGGPLIRETDNGYELIGVVSFANSLSGADDNCGLADTASFYSQVQAFKDWVESVCK